MENTLCVEVFSSSLREPDSRWREQAFFFFSDTCYLNRSNSLSNLWTENIYVTQKIRSLQTLDLTTSSLRAFCHDCAQIRFVVQRKKLMQICPSFVRFLLAAECSDRLLYLLWRIYCILIHHDVVPPSQIGKNRTLWCYSRYMYVHVHFIFNRGIKKHTLNKRDG